MDSLCQRTFGLAAPRRASKKDVMAFTPDGALSPPFFCVSNALMSVPRASPSIAQGASHDCAQPNFCGVMSQAPLRACKWLTSSERSQAPALQDFCDSRGTCSFPPLPCRASPSDLVTEIVGGGCGRACSRSQPQPKPRLRRAEQVSKKVPQALRIAFGA